MAIFNGDNRTLMWQINSLYISYLNVEEDSAGTASLVVSRYTPCICSLDLGRTRFCKLKTKIHMLESWMDLIDGTSISRTYTAY